MPPSRSVEITEVKKLEGFTTKVVLQGGWLQGVVDGEYNVYDPELPDDTVEPREVGGFWRAQIDVRPEDIKEIKSYGTVLYIRGDGPQVNCTFVCINMTFPHLVRCSPGLSTLKGSGYAILGKCRSVF